MALVAWTGVAHADTVYSNLSSTSPIYDGTGGNLVDGSSAQGSVGAAFAAMAFTPGADYTLLQVNVALSTFLGGDSTSLVSIDSDSSDAPGTVLESWDVKGLPATPTGGDTLQELPATSSIILAAGHQYWIEVGPADNDSNGVWDFTNSGPGGTAAIGKAWFQSPGPGVTEASQSLDAYDVLGTPLGIPGGPSGGSPGGPSTMPEPSGLALLSAGLLALLAAHKLRFTPEA